MTLSQFEKGIHNSVKLIQSAHSIVAITGAGISTPSGIPDFRTNTTGLWEQNDPLKVASLSAFQHQPEIFFNWLRPLSRLIMAANPNSAHFSLAAFEKMGKLRAVITQNIDGLHQKAGSQEVIELHGNLTTWTCLSCGTKISLETIRVILIDSDGIPVCPRCSRVLKPDIVLYEEQLSAVTLQHAEEMCIQSDLVMVIGSSLKVFPAADLPMLALKNNAKFILNTLSSTYLDRLADQRLPYDSSLVLPIILDRLTNF